MQIDKLIEQIAAHQSLDSLQLFLKSHRNSEKLRGKLLASFDSVREYNDTDEWITAVQICESLAIVGWGPRERVDSISRFNGDLWETYFINATGDMRFRQARWTKRKAGWSLFNPTYHASPDVPDVPSKSWELFAGQEFPSVICPKLPSQRNYQKQMPIIMGTIGGGSNSECVSRLKRELTNHLIRAMHPSMYGEALEHFFFTLHTGYEGVKYSRRLKIGSLNPKRKTFSCDLFFDDGFETLKLNDQKAYFSDNINTAIDALELKLRKKSIDYDVNSFRSDVNSAFKAWK